MWLGAMMQRTVFSAMTPAKSLDLADRYSKKLLREAVISRGSFSSL
jgi:hypothetical protein